VPDNTYRCRGDDQWIAITATADSAFAALARVLGAPALAADPRFETFAARKANESALDEEIDRLCAGFDAHDLAYRLQESGVAAGPVAKASDLFADPQLDYRRFFRRLDHAELGDHAVLTHSFRLSGADAGPHRAAPLLGEHTFEIARDLLGMDEAHIADLVAREVLH
jgi:benzylsuccinate CoA-transferase BbsF subunit